MKKLMFAAFLMFVSLNVTKISAMETVWSKQAHSGSLLLFKTSPDEKYIYTIGADKIYKKWDANTGEMLEQKALKFDIKATDVNAEGTIIYYGTFNDSLCSFFSYDIKKDSNELITQYTDTMPRSYIGKDIKKIWFRNIGVKFLRKSNKIIISLSYEYPYANYKWTGSGYEGKIDIIDLKTKMIENNIGNWFSYSSLISNNDEIFINSGYRGYSASSANSYVGNISWGLNEYNTNTNKKEFVANGNCPYLSLSQNGRFVSGNVEFGSDIKIWDLDNKNLIQEWKDNYYYYKFINSVFSNTGTFLIISCSPNTGLKNKTIEIRHIKTGYIVDSLLYQNKNYNLYPSIDTAIFYSYSTDGILTKWTSNSLKYKIIPDFVTNYNSCSKYTKIQLTDKSIGDIISYFWDFGDGAMDTAQNPTHVYFKKGIYDLKLVVSDGKTKDSIIKKNFIQINDFVKDNNFSIDSLWSTKISDASILKVEFSETGDKVYAASFDGKIKAFEIMESNLVFNKTLKEPISIFAFSKNKEKIAYGKSDGSFYLQNINSDTSYGSTKADITNAPFYKYTTGITNKYLTFLSESDSILFFTFFNYYLNQ